MHLLVIRHGIAEGREGLARTSPEDGERPLTREGRRKMERGARGLRELVPEVDLLASSPLRRAAESADLIARAYGRLRVKQVPDLAPGRGVDRVIAWLKSQPARDTIAVVGHEPDLSFMVCALLCGADNPFLELRKGAACLLDLPGRVARGAATLDWLLGPKHLRRLATEDPD
jgi:phosphohistidine phosphatase